MLPTTPTPKSFTDAWTKKFEEVLQEGAGRDGRLSVTEARRISERFDGGRFFSDNAVDYLLAKGQKSVSVSKLVDAGRAYVLDQSTRAANWPTPLVGWYDIGPLPKRPTRSAVVET